MAVLTREEDSVERDGQALIREARRIRRRRWLITLSIVVALALLIWGLMSLRSTPAPPQPPHHPALAAFTVHPPTPSHLAVSGGFAQCKGARGVLLPGYGTQGMFAAPLPAGGAVVGYQASSLRFRGPQQAPLILEALNARCAPDAGFGPGGKVTLQLPFPNTRHVPPTTQIGGEAWIDMLATTPGGNVLVFGNYGRELIGVEVNGAGHLVEGFGTHGWVTINNRAASELDTNVTTIVPLRGGRILVGVDDGLGEGKPWLIYELDSHGKLISSFGVSGCAYVAEHGAALTQLISLRNGSFVAVGWLQTQINMGREVIVALDARGRVESAVTANIHRSIAGLPTNNLVEATAYSDANGGIGIIGWGTVNPQWNSMAQAMAPRRPPAFGFSAVLASDGSPASPDSVRLIPAPPMLYSFGNTNLPAGDSLIDTSLPKGKVVFGNVRLAGPPRWQFPFLILHTMRSNGLGADFGYGGSRVLRLPGPDLDGGVTAELVPGPAGNVDVAVVQVGRTGLGTAIGFFEVTVPR